MTLTWEQIRRYSSNNYDAWDLFAENGIIVNGACRRCDAEVGFVDETNMFMCTDITCRATEQVRFCMRSLSSTLTYIQIFNVLLGISRNDTVRKIAEETGVHYRRVSRIRSEISTRIDDWFAKTPEGFDETMLGGFGTIVEIDEALLGRRKYHRGSHNRQKWCLGMAERGSSRTVTRLVERRDEGEMLPIILRHVRPGTVVHTDKWKAYRNLMLTYRHRTVNHSIEFVAPDGTDTNLIEGTWRHLRLSLGCRGTLKCGLAWFTLVRSLEDRSVASILETMMKILDKTYAGDQQ